MYEQPGGPSALRTGMWLVVLMGLFVDLKVLFRRTFLLTDGALVQLPRGVQLLVNA